MMKTYTLAYAFMALMIFGCSKSDETTTEDGGKTDQSVPADYTLLVNSNGMLNGVLLNGDAETLNLNDGDSGFQKIAEPLLISEEDKVLTMYHKKSACSGEITVHDFGKSTSKSFEVFADLGACTLTAKSIVKGGNTIYIGYEKEVNAGSKEFLVRAVDISGSETTFDDVTLVYDPVGLAFSKNRLFIFGHDKEITDEYKLTVLNAESNSEIFEDNLGFDPRSIFKNPEGNVIIGYDELHTTYNSATLGLEYTNYPLDKEPNFLNSAFKHFDSKGKMYYAMLAGTHSEYPLVPAIYDFDKNLTVLYAYENFLTETQLNFEFEIENTTVVHFDEANNLLLVGYKKSGAGDKGGLLRIKPKPEPKFAGNLDLDGVPYAIYID